MKLRIDIQFICIHKKWQGTNQKLSTSIICDRLNTFANEPYLINEVHANFRKGYCTNDKIFVFDFLCKYANMNNFNFIQEVKK